MLPFVATADHRLCRRRQTRFRFGNPQASLRSELWAMALHVPIGGMALILGWVGLIASHRAAGGGVRDRGDLRSSRGQGGQSPGPFREFAPAADADRAPVLAGILARLTTTA
jgi:hypothetical protein